MRDSFIFYRSFATAARKMNEHQKAQFLDVLCDYSLDNKNDFTGLDIVVDISFSLIKPLIDKNNIQFENGKKGGRPKKNETQLKPNSNPIETQLKPSSNPIETQLKPSSNPIETQLKPSSNPTPSNDKDVYKDVHVNGIKEKDNTDVLSTKKNFGEHGTVSLTDQEYEKLKNRLGNRFEMAIKKLDDYKASNGKKYKSDYAAINSWVEREVKNAPIEYDFRKYE